MVQPATPKKRRKPTVDRQAQAPNQVAASNQTLRALLPGRRPAWMADGQQAPPPQHTTQTPTQQPRPTPSLRILSDNRPSSSESSCAAESYRHAAPSAQGHTADAPMLLSPALTNEPSPAATASCHEGCAAAKLTVAGSKLSEGNMNIAQSDVVDMADMAGTPTTRDHCANVAPRQRIEVCQSPTTLPISPPIPIDSHQNATSTTQSRLPGQTLPTPPAASVTSKRTASEVQLSASGASAEYEHTTRSPKRTRTIAEDEGILTHGTAAVFERWKTELSQRAARLHNSGQLDSQLENARLNLLHSACTRRDLFYVTLHRHFCHWSLDPALVQRTLGCQPAALDTTFGTLLQVLRSNDELSHNSLVWLAAFPQDLHQALKSDKEIREAATVDVVRFVNRFSQNWTKMLREVAKRKFPLLAFEVTQTLACPSLSLQETLFTVSRRKLGIDDGSTAVALNTTFADALERQQQAVHGGTNLEAMRKYGMQTAERYLDIISRCRQAPPRRQESLQDGSPSLPAALPQAPGHRATQQLQMTTSHSPDLTANKAPAAAGSWPQSANPSGHQHLPAKVNAYRIPPHFENSAHQAEAETGPSTAQLSGQRPYETPTINPTRPGAPYTPTTASSVHPTPATHFPSEYSRRLSSQNTTQLSSGATVQSPPRLPHGYTGFQSSVQWASQHVQGQHAPQPTQGQYVQHSMPNQRPRSHHRIQSNSPGVHRQRQPSGAEGQQAQYPTTSSMLGYYSPYALPTAHTYQTQLLALGHGPPQAAYHNRQQQQSHLHQGLQLQFIPTAQNNGQPVARSMMSVHLPQQGRVTAARAATMMPAQTQGHSQPVSQMSQRRVAYTDMTSSPIPQAEYPRNAQDYTSVRPSLHLLHLRSPKRVPEALEDGMCYQYVSSLTTKPTALPPKTGLRILRFSTSQDQFRSLATALEASGNRISKYTNGSRRFRLRVCLQKASDTHVPESVWIACPSYWPEHIFLRVNGQPVIPRRKRHFSRDMPMELTDLVKLGENVVEISLPQSPQNIKSNSTYFVAVEEVTIATGMSVSAMVKSQRNSSTETANDIRRRLRPTDSDSDDVVVENDTLHVSLADPFSSSMFDIPVRSIHCKHLECFDLQNWLDTRKSTTSRPHPLLSNVDAWSCPICASDARPCSLRVDEYFVGVRDKLIQEGKSDVKAIVAALDGNWNAIEERNDEGSESDTGDTKVVHANNARSGQSTPSRSGGIIEIIDD